MNDIIGFDLVPEPRIIIAAMQACRRINDISVAIRFLEAVKLKCVTASNYAYIIQEISPVLCELGIETPEELGFGKPELWLENTNEM